jgi:hypothetical protein
MGSVHQSFKIAIGLERRLRGWVSLREGRFLVLKSARIEKY